MRFDLIILLIFLLCIAASDYKRDMQEIYDDLLLR